MEIKPFFRLFLGGSAVISIFASAKIRVSYTECKSLISNHPKKRQYKKEPYENLFTKFFFFLLIQVYSYFVPKILSPASPSPGTI